MTAAVSQAGAVKACLQDDQDPSDHNEEDDNGGPPGGEVAELVERNAICHPLIFTPFILLFISQKLLQMSSSVNYEADTIPNTVMATLQSSVQARDWGLES